MGERPIYAHTPKHLGDAVLCLPALHALASQGPLVLRTVPHLTWLYAELPPWQAANPANTLHARAAVLFKPSFSAAVLALACPRRIGEATDHRGPLLTEILPTSPGHRAEAYLRLSAHLGGLSKGLPQLRRPLARPEPGPGPDAALLLPGSATPTAAWPGFPRLAQLLQEAGHPVWVCPDHTGFLPPGLEHLPRLGHAPDLATIAAAGRAAGLVIGNDSGLTHLVAAARRGVGLSPARVHGIALSTEPARTGAPGATWHRPPNPPDCAPCYRKQCRHAPGRPPCMALSPDALLPRLLRSIRHDPHTLPNGPPGLFG